MKKYYQGRMRNTNHLSENRVKFIAQKASMFKTTAISITTWPQVYVRRHYLARPTDQKRCSTIGCLNTGCPKKVFNKILRAMLEY